MQFLLENNASSFEEMSNSQVTKLQGKPAQLIRSKQLILWCYGNFGRYLEKLVGIIQNQNDKMDIGLYYEYGKVFLQNENDQRTY